MRVIPVADLDPSCQGLPIPGQWHYVNRIRGLLHWDLLCLLRLWHIHLAEVCPLVEMEVYDD